MKLKMTFVAWERHNRRTEILARHLGASLHHICYGQRGNLALLPWWYLVQAWKTWAVSRRERPDIVLAQNPPIFCALVAFIYAKSHGKQYVIDSHTGAFLSSKWRWALGLHRFLSRSALLTIVHNTHQQAIVDQWGCRNMVIAFTGGSYPEGESFPVKGKYNIAVVCSFERDEPVDVIFQAARQSPHVTFYITGDGNRLPAEQRAAKPDNCVLTGYLPYARYIGLLRAVDAVLVLTTREGGVLLGGFEAVSVGTPLIISDWPILKEYFAQGTVHVPNTVQGICRGIDRVEDELPELRRGIIEMQRRWQVEWEEQLATLVQILSSPPAAPLTGQHLAPTGDRP